MAIITQTTPHHSYSVRENLKLKVEEEIVSELKLYKRLGGGTICDLTSIGLRYIHTPATVLNLILRMNMI